MELENRIRSLLELDKFKDLSPEEKEQVFNSILANCLILSKENQNDFLEIISECLESIENLKDSHYHLKGACYSGIVEGKAGKALDQAQTIFPFIYHLKFKEFSTPLAQMTKSILHEFGHLAVKKDGFRLTDTTYLIPTGGLVISKLLKDDYGHMFNEIINELTNLLSYKAFLAYHTPNPDQEQKMQEFAEKMGVKVDEGKEWLKVLPKNLFTSYTELELSTSTLEEGTESMFNPLYVKYTPLVRLILFVFQNPTCTYQDLKDEFEKGNGLEAKKDGLPINDLFYGYYVSPLHVQFLFDALMGQGTWEKFCLEFDSKMMDKDIDRSFVDSAIELFSNFYHQRLFKMVKQKKITKAQLVEKEEELIRIKQSCVLYYDNINNNHALGGL